MNIPWELKHEVIGIGGVCNTHREFIVDSKGNRVGGTISHATEITEDGDRRHRDYADLNDRPWFNSGESYPYSDKGRFIVQSANSHDDLVATLRETASFLESLLYKVQLTDTDALERFIIKNGDSVSDTVEAALRNVKDKP